MFLQMNWEACNVSDLMAQKDALHEELYVLESKQSELYQKLDALSSQVIERRLHSMHASQTEYLVKRLNRLKVYIGDIPNVDYQIIQQKDPNMNHHELMLDTLNWKIKDYDGLLQKIEIQFKIQSPTVISFVTRWFFENVPFAKQKSTIMARH